MPKLEIGTMINQRQRETTTDLITQENEKTLFSIVIVSV